MTRDRLFLLDQEFADAALPGRTFCCKECMSVEGLLAAFPERALNIEVTRVSFPRPRAEVVDLIGEANQVLPSLVFAEGGFVNSIDELLSALHTRHGFPEPHP
jgi:hypothetical protein